MHRIFIRIPPTHRPTHRPAHRPTQHPAHRPAHRTAHRPAHRTAHRPAHRPAHHPRTAPRTAHAPTMGQLAIGQRCSRQAQILGPRIAEITKCGAWCVGIRFGTYNTIHDSGWILFPRTPAHRHLVIFARRFGGGGARPLEDSRGGRGGGVPGTVCVILWIAPINMRQCVPGYG